MILAYILDSSNAAMSTEMSYWAKSYVTIFMRAAHCLTYFYFSKPKLTLKLLKVFEY